MATYLAMPARSNKLVLLMMGTPMHRTCPFADKIVPVVCFPTASQ